MTTLNTAKEAVYLRFVTNFTALAADRITFDNEEFDIPSTGDWVRLAVRSVSRVQETLGKKTNRVFRSSATVFVQVFTRVNTGTMQSDLLTKAAADVFEGESFSGLDFKSVLVRELGPEGAWFRAVAEAEFDFDEIK